MHFEQSTLVPRFSHTVHSASSKERKKVNMQKLQPNSGHSIFSYGRYAEKFFSEIYRDLYGDTMLVPIEMVTAINVARKPVLSFATQA